MSVHMVYRSVVIPCLLIDTLVFGALTAFGTWFVLTTVGHTSTNTSRMVCLVGAINDRPTKVNVTSGDGVSFATVRVDKYDVTSLELNSSQGRHSRQTHWAVVLRSSSDFIVSVVIVHINEAHSFLAIPVHTWGRTYYTATVRLQPIIQILGAYNRTSVNMVIGRGSHADLSRAGTNWKRFTGGKLVIRLNQYLVYILNLCESINEIVMKGTVINSNKPIGVVSGNGRFGVGACRHNATQTRSGLLAHEMMLPKEVYGMVFVLVSSRWSREVKHIFTGIEAHTVITISVGEDEPSLSLYLRTPGEMQIINSSTKYRYVVSNRPIQVLIVDTASCRGTAHVQATDYCLSTASPVIPTVLFYHTYMWRTMSINSTIVMASVLVVVKTTDYDYLLLDNKKLTCSERTTVLGNDNWETGIHQSNEGIHVMSSTSKSVMFGCYLLGSTGSLQPAGYYVSQDTARFSPLCSVCHTGSGHKRIQKRDEDVEEFWNWGSWVVTECSDVCRFDSKALAVRVCVLGIASNASTCEPGDKQREREEKTCPWTTICPEECPEGTYDYNCTKLCTNCLPDCEKHAGYCFRCKPGYRGMSPGENRTFCQDECPNNTYGLDCRGSCLAKCGTECLSTVTGQCPFNKKWLFLLLLLLILPLGICFVCVIRWARKEPPKKVEKKEHKIASERVSNMTSNTEEDISNVDGDAYSGVSLGKVTTKSILKASGSVTSKKSSDSPVSVRSKSSIGSGGSLKSRSSLKSKGSSKSKISSKSKGSSKSKVSSKSKSSSKSKNTLKSKSSKSKASKKSKGSVLTQSSVRSLASKRTVVFEDDQKPPFYFT